MFAALVLSQSGGTCRASTRDVFAIILTNLASFGIGELLLAMGLR